MSARRVVSTIVWILLAILVVAPIGLWITLALWFRPVAGWVTPLEATGPAGRIPDNRLFVGTGVVGDLSGAGVSLSRAGPRRARSRPSISRCVSPMPGSRR